MIGNETDYFNGQAEIVLHGNSSDPDFDLSDRIEIGHKALIVAGKAEFFGQKRSGFSRLYRTIYKSENSTFVEPELDWKTGDKVALLPTATQSNHTDYMEISVYDELTGYIEFTGPVQYYHWGQEWSTDDDYNGVDMRGEVVLLSRNVRVLGSGPNDFSSQVVVTEHTESDGINRLGKFIFDNVEVYGCSQSDSSNSAIRFENTHQNTQYLRDSTIWGGQGWGLSINRASNIEVYNSAIIGGKSIGARVLSAQNVTLYSMVVGDISSRNISGTTLDKEACYSICSYE